MKFVPEVDKTQVHPELWVFLAFLDGEVGRWSKEQEITVTSLRRRNSPRPTKHQAVASEAFAAADPDVYPEFYVMAVDVRRWGLDAVGCTERFCQDIQARFAGRIGVVLEPEWLSRTELEERFGLIITTDEEEQEAREKVAPHIHFQLKLPVRWEPFR